MENFERIIKTRQPFDKRNTDPKKNYGVGSMTVTFILKGEKGAMQFVLNTGGYLENVVNEWAREKRMSYSDGSPSIGFLQGWDLGYHSPKPMHEGQSVMKDCQVLNGDCYYDGTSLGAEKPLQIYIQEGEEGLWKFLEQEYKERFDNGNRQTQRI